MLHRLRHPAGVARVAEDGLARERPERLVQVAAAAREVLVPLRHEGRDHAVPRADLLRGRLEKRRFVGAPQGRVVADGRLVNAGTGLGVEAFQLDVEGGHAVDQRVHERRVLARAEPRVPEHSRREGREVRVSLLPQGLRRLLEEEELVLARRLHRETHRASFVVDAAEQLSRRDRERFAR